MIKEIKYKLKKHIEIEEIVMEEDRVKI